MATEYFKEFEKEILDIVKETVNEFGKQLKRENYEIKGPKIKILNDDLANYTSEFEISFWKNNNPGNIIEFFICYKGNKNVTKSEVKNHIKEEIQTLFANPF